MDNKYCTLNELLKEVISHAMTEGRDAKAAADSAAAAFASGLQAFSRQVSQSLPEDQ